MKGKKSEIWLPYVLILAAVLLLEVFVFNFSTWKMLGTEPIMLAEQVTTNESGSFTTGRITVNDRVSNVDVRLSLENCDRAEVEVMLTDEGDYYEYWLPAYQVVPEAADSGYCNIYPFGEVRDIEVMVTVPEGAGAEIASVALNVQRPFYFRPIRVGALFAILAMGYALAASYGWLRKPCERGRKEQWAGIAAVSLCLAILAFFMVRSNPIWVNPVWGHHRQYQELAQSLTRGRVSVDKIPAPELLAKDNPYDTIALSVEGIPYEPDYALHNGQYYVYFGIVPELLFYLPYYALTGGAMPNYLVVYAFYLMLIAGVFGTVWEWLHRNKLQISFVLYLMISVVLCIMPQYGAALVRPDMYYVPIMAANAFVWLGTFCWLRAGNSQRTKWLWYGMGSAFMACIMGCRPQMGLYAMVVFCVLLLPELWKQKRKWKAYIKEIAAFILPILAVAAVVFWYNLARFGSGLDFGATYSLTSNDMNHRGFNFARILRGLYCFLFQPPVINGVYPFLDSCELNSGYMGKNIVEFTYGGYFAVCPLLLSLLYPLLGGMKRLQKQEKVWIVGLASASLVVAAFDVNGAGVLQRYMCDMVFGFALAAAAVVLRLLHRHREHRLYPWEVKGVYGCFLFSAVFLFFIVITSADSNCIEKYNPVLFYELASLFKF